MSVSFTVRLIIGLDRTFVFESILVVGREFNQDCSLDEDNRTKNVVSRVFSSVGACDAADVSREVE